MYKRRQWTEDELHYLEAHYADEPNVTLSEHFGRSEQAVQLMAKKLGLTGCKKRRPKSKNPDDVDTAQKAKECSNLLPICSKCQFRVPLVGKSMVPSKMNRLNSMCCYLDRTGEQRPGSPTETACPGFSPRSRQKPKVGGSGVNASETAENSICETKNEDKTAEVKGGSTHERTETGGAGRAEREKETGLPADRSL